MLTSFRNHDWQNALTINRDCVQKSPNKPRVRANYGMALGKAGRYEEAVAQLEKAIALNRPAPYVDAANNLLVIRLRQGRVQEGSMLPSNNCRSFSRPGLLPMCQVCRCLPVTWRWPMAVSNGSGRPRLFCMWGSAFKTMPHISLPTWRTRCDGRRAPSRRARLSIWSPGRRTSS